MKRIVHSPASAVVALLAFLALAGVGCRDSTSTQPIVVPVKPDSVYAYSLVASTMRPLRNGEAYSLWMRYKGDTSYRFEGHFQSAAHGTGDTSVYAGWFYSTKGLDSIQELAMTVQGMTDTIRPAAFLMRSTPTGSKSKIVSVFRTFDSTERVALTGLSANVLYLSSTADSNRAKHEFYLADTTGSGLKASLSALPVAPAGWTYALWVIDSNFFPFHQFLYGTFSRANGHDSDSLADAFPFPGGYRSNNLNDPGGMIEVTLEPLWIAPSLMLAGQSVFPILYMPLPRFISNHMIQPMTNVVGTSMISGTLSVSK